MNHGELIQALADRLGEPKTKAKKAADVLCEVIQTALMAGEEVPLPSLGKLTIAQRAGRRGRNPRTGEVVTYGPSKRVRFLPARSLKDAVNR